MGETKQLKWEVIARETKRLPVFGGWLICVDGIRELTFIGDTLHEWKLPEYDDPRYKFFACGH